MKKTTILWCILLLGLIPISTFAQLGTFEQTADWGTRGEQKVDGSVNFDGSTYSVQGNGDDIWDNLDEGFFVYKELTGDWSIQAKVKWNDTGGHSWAKAGIMIREQGDSPTSKHFWMLLRGEGMGDSVDTQWRTNTRSESFNQGLLSAGGDNAEVFLRVTYIAAENLFYSHYSLDGTTWLFHHQETIEMQEPLAYGLAVTNHNDDDQLAEAAFNNVEINPATPQKLPPVTGVRWMPFWVVADESFHVHLELYGTKDQEKRTTVKERPPAGWNVSEISRGGVFSDGVITWNILLQSEDENGNPQDGLDYTITPPADAPKGHYYYFGTINGNTGISENYLNELVHVSVNRRLSPVPYRAGDTGTVSLRAKVTEHASIDSLAISEYVPPPLVPQNITGDGVWNENDRRIRWFLFGDYNQTFTYTVELGEEDHYEFWSPNDNPEYAFYDSESNQTIRIPILGESWWQKLYCAPHPVDTNQDFEISTSEILNGAQAWKQGEPEPTVNDLLQAASFWKKGGVYTCANDGGYISAQDSSNNTSAKVSSSNRRNAYTLANGIEAIRDLPDDYTLGNPLEVSIAITADSPPDAMAVEEIVPQGWQVSDISGGGEFNAATGSIRWFLLSGFNTELRYTIVPLSETEIFSGTLTFIDNSGEHVMDIFGETKLGQGGPGPVATPTKAPPTARPTFTPTPIPVIQPTNTPIDNVVVDGINAKRILPAECNPGERFTVSITITSELALDALAIEETVPPGWEVGTISHSGEFTPNTGTIRWFLLSGFNANLTYMVTPGNSADAFDGILTFITSNGESTVPITGDQRCGDNTSGMPTPTVTATPTPTPTLPPPPTNTPRPQSTPIPPDGIPDVAHAFTWNEINFIGGGLDGSLPAGQHHMNGDILSNTVSGGEVSTYMAANPVPIQNTALLSVLVNSSDNQGTLYLGALDQDWSGTLALQTKVNLGIFQDGWKRYTTVITPEAGGVIPLIQIVGQGGPVEVQFKDLTVYELIPGKLIDPVYLQWFTTP